MGRPRKFTPELKLKVVLETLQGNKAPAEICREYRIAEEQLWLWRQEFLDRAPALFRSSPGRSADLDRIAELERLVGQLSLELSILKKATSLLESPERRNGSS